MASIGARPVLRRHRTQQPPFQLNHNRGLAFLGNAITIVGDQNGIGPFRANA
jgi:hypothetical protein